MILDEIRDYMQEDYLRHYGMPRRSGRYPWGSGDAPTQRHMDFLDIVDELGRKGLTETQIADSQGMSIKELRATKSIANNFIKQEKVARVRNLKDSGMSNTEIGRRMGINESSVRDLLRQSDSPRIHELKVTTDTLRDAVEKHGYVQVGTGVEHHLNVSATRLETALHALQLEGYVVHKIQEDQLGTGPGMKTTVKVLAKPNTSYVDVKLNRDKIHTLGVSYDSTTRSFLGIEPPLNISSKRLLIKYAKDGGAEADGVVYVRPGVQDISLGKNRYAQVRIAIDGSHYIKGMAVYKEDLPKGIDLVFNTNKTDTGHKLDALKPLSKDPDNPFGAVVKQLYVFDKNGNKVVTSAMNMVNQQDDDWATWSNTLSSQMLSKQPSRLAREQLDLTYHQKRQDLDEILSLTNPAVRIKLLDAYADGADSSAVHLKAAHMPRQSTHVIMPINSLKDTEVYAPTFDNGERVVLIRYPHGGKFEIPELTVNNSNREGRKLLGTDPVDVVGINHKVAARLSGADFDGDTVIVIPNRDGRIKTEPALASLKNFDPKANYKLPEGVKFKGNKQQLMGDVSNLVTDMTIKGASPAEIVLAVKHSMVVIDSEKHNLDYKRSARDHQIALLKERYQGGRNRGASTVISRKKKEIKVPARIPRSAKEGGPIDPKTGKLVFKPTNESYVNRKTGKVVQKTTKVKQILEVEDVNVMSSGMPIEKIYADHANRLKALANEARREMVNTAPPKVSLQAKKIYADQVRSIDAKISLAERHRPLERAAQLAANAKVKAKLEANPDMTDSEIKKIKYLALEESRNRLGGRKPVIEITADEWAAIQAGAVSYNKIKALLNNVDMDKVRKLAMPRTSTSMSSQQEVRARAMLASGHTLSEIANALGVSTSTLSATLGGKRG